MTGRPDRAQREGGGEGRLPPRRARSETRRARRARPGRSQPPVDEAQLADLGGEQASGRRGRRWRRRRTWSRGAARRGSRARVETAEGRVVGHDEDGPRGPSSIQCRACVPAPSSIARSAAAWWRLWSLTATPRLQQRNRQDEGVRTVAHGFQGNRPAPTVLSSWALPWGVAASREAALAAPRGYCAGVDRRRASSTRSSCTAPVYVRKEIVRNKHVVEQLRERGRSSSRADDSFEGRHRLRAHGVARRPCRGRPPRLEHVDATCPLVTRSTARRSSSPPRATIVLIGHDGHEEVEGTMGGPPRHRPGQTGPTSTR